MDHAVLPSLVLNPGPQEITQPQPPYMWKLQGHSAATSSNPHTATAVMVATFLRNSGFVEKLNATSNLLVYFISLGRIMKRRVKGIFITN
ncbi:hypothetical protein AAY473_010220 [Plecturocebus cupreus]